MKDIGLTEQAKFYENFKDPSPLTDETLEELGFEKNYPKEWGLPKYNTMVINGIVLMVWYETSSRKDEIWIELSVGDTPRHKYKTVGKVKMLIEALKGDE
jgi:hypothetical protein